MYAARRWLGAGCRLILLNSYGLDKSCLSACVRTNGQKDPGCLRKMVNNLGVRKLILGGAYLVACRLSARWPYPGEPR